MTKPSGKSEQRVRSAAWTSRSMPTMDDVARLTGFSQMTVSRAFLDSSPIRKETRDRILEAAAELGYFHNKTASSLASQRLAGVRHHPADPAGLDLFSVCRRRPRGFREERRGLPAAEHRLCPQARSPGDRTAGVAARQGDPASLDRAHARHGETAARDPHPDHRGRQLAEAAHPFRGRPFRLRSRLHGDQAADRDGSAAHRHHLRPCRADLERPRPAGRFSQGDDGGRTRGFRRSGSPRPNTRSMPDRSRLPG